jgi:hypothetical protein
MISKKEHAGVIPKYNPNALLLLGVISGRVSGTPLHPLSVPTESKSTLSLPHHAIRHESGHPYLLFIPFLKYPSL